MADGKPRYRAGSPARTDRRRKRPVPDELASEADALDATVRPPTPETALPIEDQVRKTCDSKKDNGLPTGPAVPAL
jgi:hypothetical protein